MGIYMELCVTYPEILSCVGQPASGYNSIKSLIRGDLKEGAEDVTSQCRKKLFYVVGGLVKLNESLLSLLEKELKSGASPVNVLFAEAKLHYKVA